MHTIQKIEKRNGKVTSDTFKVNDEQLVAIHLIIRELRVLDTTVAIILLDTSDIEEPKATYLYRNEPLQETKQFISNPVTPAPKVYNETLGLDRAEQYKPKSPLAQ